MLLRSVSGAAASVLISDNHHFNLLERRKYSARMMTNDAASDTGENSLGLDQVLSSSAVAPLLCDPLLSL